MGNFERLDQLARTAYVAYGERTGGLNYRGEPMPNWEALGETIQAAWRCAVDAVVNELCFPDSP